MLAQAIVEYGLLSAIEEAFWTAGAQLSSWVSSWGSEKLMMIGGAVLIGLLGRRLVLRRR